MASKRRSGPFPTRQRAPQKAESSKLRQAAGSSKIQKKSRRPSKAELDPNCSTSLAETLRGIRQPSVRVTRSSTRASSLPLLTASVPDSQWNTQQRTQEVQQHEQLTSDLALIAEKMTSVMK
ncbi:hypothetical protein H4R33_000756 [Dimargaris cristalligena]|nr:hypothetical protein H4R33_000756 [Dimargaris cristalligena]